MSDELVLICLYTSVKNISLNVEGCRDGSAKNERNECTKVQNPRRPRVRESI